MSETRQPGAIWPAQDWADAVAAEMRRQIAWQHEDGWRACKGQALDVLHTLPPDLQASPGAQAYREAIAALLPPEPSHGR